jgi:hypothetical protein
MQQDQVAIETLSFPNLKGVLKETVLEPLLEDVFCTHYYDMFRIVYLVILSIYII